MSNPLDKHPRRDEIIAACIQSTEKDKPLQNRYALKLRFGLTDAELDRWWIYSGFFVLRG